ncbi:MAG TPA: hypothetical protein VLI69_09075 [Gammaproteobacteria bacterium]|nr:hypothetical protein [Gammaproteobacteria bacterium]
MINNIIPEKSQKKCQKKGFLAFLYRNILINNKIFSNSQYENEQYTQTKQNLLKISGLLCHVINRKNLKTLPRLNPLFCYLIIY